MTPAGYALGYAYREGYDGMNDDETGDVSRRTFLRGTGGVLAAAAVSPAPAAAAQAGSEPAAAVAAADVPTSRIQVTVNGAGHDLEIEDHWTLVEVLRDRLGLTGTKIGCDRGECGACTVLLDGRPVYSCSQLAAWIDGRRVDTVEGLEDANGRLSPVQQAFVHHNGPQCGFCTSGQLMSATALLADEAHPNASEVQTALSGNLCRCSNYNAIVEAVVAAAEGAPDAVAVDPPAVRGNFPPLRDRRSPHAPGRRGRARHRAGRLHRRRPAPGHGVRTRAQEPTSPRAHPCRRRLAGRGAAGRAGGHHPRACAGRLGGGLGLGRAAVQRLHQGDHQASPVLFNNPVRFVGDPVAAVAAVDRHVASGTEQQSAGAIIRAVPGVRDVLFSLTIDDPGARP